MANLGSFCLYNDVNTTEVMNTGHNRHKKLSEVKNKGLPRL